MKYLITLLIIVTSFLHLEAQNKEISTYENLPTKKTYSVSLSSSQRGGYTSYKVDGVKVGKEVYQKYKDGLDNMDACCPCILMTYDKNEKLISEAIQCTDCVVGYLKEYYPNGKVKLLAQYKENPTGDWSNISNRGYCYKEDGTWLYYNENGEIVSIEIWKDGEFIEQKPKGEKPEIWRMELLVNGETPSDNQIYMDELETFQIIPYYKNDHKFSHLKVVISIGVIGNKKQEYEISFEDLGAQKIKDIISNIETDKVKNIQMDISIFADEEKIQTMYLGVIPE